MRPARPPGVSRKLLLALGLVVVASALAVAAAVVLPGRGGGSGSADGPNATAPDVAGGGLAACRGLEGEEARACYEPVLAALLLDATDPSAALEELAAEAYARPDGFLLSHCHGLMHALGRAYGRDRVTPATLMEHLPRTNDPACAAGFAHGLVTGIAPQLDLRRPGDAAAVCAESESRYQRYSCVHGFGHAFMRVSGESLTEALPLCSALGEMAPDCAQGAYHDYWFAIAGADEAQRPPAAVEDPRELCGAQPREFVRPCWYRAFIEVRPDGGVGDPADVARLCEGLDGIQRAGCVTAASAIGPASPSNQLTLCNDVPDEDALDCVRGVKVANLLDAPAGDLVALIRQCDGYPTALAPGCYRWLAKVLAVMTNGEFERFGCPALPDPALRRECVAGARSMDEALVTFS